MDGCCWCRMRMILGGNIGSCIFPNIFIWWKKYLKPNPSFCPQFQKLLKLDKPFILYRPSSLISISEYDYASFQGLGLFKIAYA